MKNAASSRTILFFLTCIFLAIPGLFFSASCSPSHLITPGFTEVEQISPSLSGTSQPGETSTPTNEPTPTRAAVKIDSLISTASPPIQPSPTATKNDDQPLIMYFPQPGENLPSIAKRFGVEENEIYSDGPLSAYQFINPDQILYIPDNLDATGPSEAILPDSEIVFSPSAVNFDIEEFLEDKNGEIKTYLEPHVSNWYSGVRIIERAAIDYSINPRIILSILEHQSHWVYAHPKNQAEVDYPMGWINPSRPGLSMQVDYTLRRLSKGYYDWREGSLTELEFADGSRLRMAPELNAGTAALQFLYSEIYHDPDEWENALYGYDSLQEIHAHMFENAWRRDQA